jgi:phosphoglycolate phosphatase
MTKKLLFDFDGTIADTARSGLKIYNEIALKKGYSPIEKTDLQILRDMGVLDIAKHLKIPLLELPSLVMKIREALRKEVTSLAVIDGMNDALRALKDKGHELYIVSSNSVENIKAFLEYHGITVFDGVTSVFDLFGKEHEITKLIDAKKWDHSSVIYIGDEVRDIIAAKRAQILSVAVSWGFNSVGALAKESPDMLLNDPSALTAL